MTAARRYEVRADGPDPRVVEDLIERGRLSLVRSERAADEDTLRAIRTAADWLIARARELREGTV